MNNDLISREALKEDLAKEIKTNDMGLWLKILLVIDNAPTVEIPVARWDCYCEGQKVGYEKALSERPQGEWIKVKEERMSIDMSGEIVTRYKCSKCGRVIATFPSKLADYYPFCHCGAKMKI